MGEKECRRCGDEPLKDVSCQKCGKTVLSDVGEDVIRIGKDGAVGIIKPKGDEVPLKCKCGSAKFDVEWQRLCVRCKAQMEMESEEVEDEV